MADGPDARYDDLSAVFVNCTLKRSPEPSHTQDLADNAIAILQAQGVAVDQIRAVDHDLPAGVYPDMTEHGAAADDWPALFERVVAADILIVGTPIWLGEKSSVCTSFVERMYAMSGQLNDEGQSIYYGRVAAALVTGNEDGIKHCAMSILYAMSHLGYTIPPQADAGWIGEAGPGPSYGDEREDGSRVGYDNDFTRRNTTIMVWNLLHLARMMKDHGGIPSWGNDREAIKAGATFDHPNPEYRS